MCEKNEGTINSMKQNIYFVLSSEKLSIRTKMISWFKNSCVHKQTIIIVGVTKRNILIQLKCILNLKYKRWKCNYSPSRRLASKILLQVTQYVSLEVI